MKKNISQVLAAAAALLMVAAAAQAAAFDELSANSPARAFEPAAAVTAPAAVLPPDLMILPDDNIREDLPVREEILPAPSGLRPASVIDPQNLIPADLKTAAQAYYLANAGKIGNLRYVGVVDFARHSSFSRFYVADTADGTVKVYHVAHGSGSDPDKDGYATIFSNVRDSNASSLGFYLTGEIYYGKHGRSMRLHGLSSTNSNAYARAVVIHSADYVSENNVQPGRSWGCLAVSTVSLDTVIAELNGGALIYAGLSGAR